MYHENINQIYETIRNNFNKELIINAKLDDVNQIHETIQKNDDNLIIARKHDDINQMQDTTQKYLIIKMKHDHNSLIQENTDTDLIISMKHYDFNQIYETIRNNFNKELIINAKLDDVNQIHEPFQNSFDKGLIVIIIGDDLKQISGTIQINGDKKLIIIMKYDDINYINDIIQKNVEKDLKMIMKYNDNEMECELRSKQQFITKDATKNLKIRGFIGLYEVGEIQCTSTEIMAASATQIVLGVAVFGLGSFFPIVMPFAQMISVTLLSEGILDIVVWLIGGKLALDWNYFKSKLIAIGVTAISMGLFALSGFINKLITKARSLLSYVNQSLKMLGNFDSIINCVEEFLIKSKSLINMANNIYLPNYVASKPLLSVLWQATDRVLRKPIISNIIDIKYQQLFIEKWKNIYETIRLWVDKEFFGKLNANILLILNSRKGYDIFLSKLESMNISKNIDKNDLKLMAQKFIIHTNLDTAMWFAAFLAMIDKIYSIIVKIFVPFLNQLKKEIEDAFKNIIGDKKETGGHDPDYLNDSQIKITEKISKMLYDLINYHTIKNSRKHDNNDTSDKDDKEEIERILNQTDPYVVLNLNQQQIVTIADLNKTFAALSLKYRPNNIDKELSDVFQKIQWAYTEIKKQINP
ncbi:uncharacterized protein LOC123295007 [Chrysoperla carnea]|uniref:uncharacterized protein LOC123295007 n=1 Tax=Chrysoperla carnea TaxID=189513 RepID=UPI001D074E56|nr:uncharacterized protein LOC123295007 [Chrysoperla carnea]